MAKIIIDPGHGGWDNGATYQGRREKDDNLTLALILGEMLGEDGNQVVYTRTTDMYQSPREKAQVANAAGGDLFLSLHRNSSPAPNMYSGVQTLLYSRGGEKENLANEINGELEKVGFQNLGISIRPELTVLRETQMPAVLIESGFLNTQKDNELFDQNLREIARAIANGVRKTLGNALPLYYVQTGLFTQRENAENLQKQLMQDGFPSAIIRAGAYDSVLAGGVSTYAQAEALERELLQKGYETLIIYR